MLQGLSLAVRREPELSRTWKAKIGNLIILASEAIAVWTWIPFCSIITRDWSRSHNYCPMVLATAPTLLPAQALSVGVRKLFLGKLFLEVTEWTLHVPSELEPLFNLWSPLFLPLITILQAALCLLHPVLGLQSLGSCGKKVIQCVVELGAGMGGVVCMGLGEGTSCAQ